MNVRKRLLHALLHAGVDDLRSHLHISPLGRLRNRETHATDAGLVYQVDNQFQFVQALEVGHLRLVTGFDQHLVAGLDQCARSATKYGLLTEQVGLGFLLEGGLYNPGACAADSLSPGERDLLGLTVGILVDGNETGHPLSLNVLATDNVPRPLGCHEDHVDVLRRNNRLEVDREAVGKEQRLALGQVRLDIVLVHFGLAGVRHSNKNDICPLNGLSIGVHLEPPAPCHLC